MPDKFLLSLSLKTGLLLLLLFSVSCTNPPAAGSKTMTKDEHVACYKKKWMEDMLDFIRTENRAKFTSYIQDRRCLFMRGGRKVELTDPPGIFGSLAGFKMGGVKYWTSKDSLLYDQ